MPTLLPLPFSIRGRQPDPSTPAVPVACMLLICTLLPGATHAQAQDLFSLSLAELMQIEARPAADDPAEDRANHRLSPLNTSRSATEPPANTDDSLVQLQQMCMNTQPHCSRSTTIHP